MARRTGKNAHDTAQQAAVETLYMARRAAMSGMK
jgi:hypothetical protein